MKVGIITALVGLLGLVGFASADFIMIKVDLNVAQKFLAAPNVADPNQPANPAGVGGAAAGPGAFLGKAGPGAGAAGAQPNPGAMPTGESPLWVYACFELKTKPKLHQTYLEFEHPWGKQTLVHTQIIKYLQKDTLLQTYQKSLKEEQKTGKLLPGMLKLAAWCLQHGMSKQFHDIMGDLKKEYPKDPSVVAYGKVQAALKKKPAGDDPGARGLVDDLKREGYRSTNSDAGHYTLLANLTLNPQNDVIIKRYLGRMEETFENFFYWFTVLKEPQVLPLPPHRLTAVLVMNPKEFHNKHVVWGSLPMVADGFTPRRDNVMILSGQRLDEPFTQLKRDNEHAWNNLKISRDEFLSGTIWKRKDAFTNVSYTSVLQTLALVQKAMEEEAERAMITHEGTRQLLAGTGLLPRNVEAPEWVLSGLASFFDTPYGAFYPGLGLPSWTQLVGFKHARKTGKLPKSSDVLYQVVTDRLFRKARQASALHAGSKEDTAKLLDKSQQEWELARSTSWAFVYYLAHNQKAHYLRRYFDELNGLPRDLELDERALQGCFARAFQLADSTDPNRLDTQKLQQLADDWFAQMDGVTLEIPEVEGDALKSREQPKAAAPAAGG